MQVEFEEDDLPLDAPPGVVLTCSVARGACPDPGIHAAPYLWRDVTQSPPPRRKARGAGMHFTYHLTEHGVDVRLAYVTHVRVDPGADPDSPDDDVIIVDEAVFVQRRALQELIDREKAFSDRFAIRGRARLAKHLARQRAYANRLRAKWVIALFVLLIRLEAKVGFAAIRGVRGFLRGLVHVPDAILARSSSASTHLASRTARHSLRRAFLDPSNATAEEKGVLVLVSTAGLIGLVLLLNTVFALGLSQWAPYYTAILGDALYSFGNAFLPLPVPPEVGLVTRTISLGLALGWTGWFAGKLVGSWILFLAGDALHDGLKKQTARSAKLARVVAWLQIRAQRSGFLWVFVLSVVPFLPDTLILAFAVSGMRFRPFMWAIFLGTAIKYGAILLAIAFVGPATVGGWLDAVAYWANPFHWIGL